MATTTVCEGCGQEFRAQRKTARFCSATCRKRASRATPDEVAALRAEADRLQAMQKVVHTDEDGREFSALEHRTVESEERAEEILRLRRRAAVAENPL